MPSYDADRDAILRLLATGHAGFAHIARLPHASAAVTEGDTFRPQRLITVSLYARQKAMSHVMLDALYGAMLYGRAKYYVAAAFTEDSADMPPRQYS